MRYSEELMLTEVDVLTKFSTVGLDAAAKHFENSVAAPAKWQ